MKKIILIDLDDVVVDYNKSFLAKVEEKGWEMEKSDGIYLKIKNDENDFKKISIESEKDFFLNLVPIEKAVKNVKKIIEDKRFEVFFCSAPIDKYENCVPEKYKGVEKYFGFEMTSKVILTGDKTLIKGDYLIDDNPEIKGANENPEGKQIFYTQKYNENIEKDRISDGDQGEKVLF